jgi:hypothetical protein
MRRLQTMQDLPNYIAICFILTTLLCLVLLMQAVRSADKLTTQPVGIILLCLTAWLVIQSTLTLKGIYSSNTTVLPPRILVLGILPAFICIASLFITKRGRLFIDSLSLKHLHYVHVVRVPVEIVLYFLAAQKVIPELMTFTGRNFDILAGLTAPLIVMVAFTQTAVRKRLLLVWNFACLALLINIIVHGLLSAPSPLQQLAFDQPNIAILHWPFSLLPTFIVPVVLFCHLASIRKLMS